MNPLCFLDIETTGTDTETDRIVEIAIVKDEQGELTEFQSLVNPQIPIPRVAEEIHGITDQDVQDAPTMAEVAPTILQFLMGSDIAGFNSNTFDVPLLLNELERCGHSWDLRDVHFIDVGNIFKRREPRTLAAAVQFYAGRNHDDAHGALSDVRATREVFLAQQMRYADLPSIREELALYCNYDRKRADLAGKFAYNERGELVLTFGQHKGIRAREVPDYLRWMLRSDFARDTKAVAASILETTPSDGSE